MCLFMCSHNNEWKTINFILFFGGELRAKCKWTRRTATNRVSKKRKNCDIRKSFEILLTSWLLLAIYWRYSCGCDEFLSQIHKFFTFNLIFVAQNIEIQFFSSLYTLISRKCRVKNSLSTNLCAFEKLLSIWAISAIIWHFSLCVLDYYSSIHCYQLFHNIEYSKIISF